MDILTIAQNLKEHIKEFIKVKTLDSLDELKELDTQLTNISKSNARLSSSQLAQIGKDSFSVASQYGKEAADYLSAVQEMTDAGYENAQGLAQLSLAIQSTCNLTSDLANQYIFAADQGYQFGGSIEKLTEVFDGTNSIANHNAVNMTELAEAMSLAGSHASSAGIEIDETTAALSTMLAVTNKSGSDIADAWDVILSNLSQVSDADISTDGLLQYENACNALNVSLKETRNGMISLRDPIHILEDLSKSYSALSSNDTRKNDLLNSVGGGIKGEALDALLSNWNLYEKMMQDYASGAGSMALEAENTANSWEGSLNRLSNTWTETIGNIANSDAVTVGINALNGLLSVSNLVTESLGSLGSIGLIGGAAAFIKNLDHQKVLKTA